jgi:hypothetical protein
MKFLILLSLLSASAFGYINPMEDTPELEPATDGSQHPMNEKLVAAYCIGKKGTAPISLKEFKYTSEIICDEGRSSLFFYEAWISKNDEIKSGTVSILDLDPPLKEKERKFYYNGIAVGMILGTTEGCENKQVEDQFYVKCPRRNGGKQENITEKIERIKNTDIFNFGVSKAISDHGQSSYQALYGPDKRPEAHENNTPMNKNDDKKDSGNVVNVVDTKKTTPTDVKVVVKDSPDPKNQDKALVVLKTDVTDADGADVKEDIKADPDCDEELNKEIAALLADDTKNIIGLQYELTVLKMAALATESKTNSIEGVIRQQSKKIDAIDDGVINKMNVMYKKHGLPEDAAAITSHLKQKSSSANYFAKNKRFFNQDSSAFLLAYQEMNKNSGIKDSDVSVLWFMDKVSEKTKGQSGKYSAAHNLTNLSTRLAQYTSAIDPKKALSKPALDEMVRRQNGKIGDEFLDLIQNFKTSNPACYASLFGDGEADTQCNLGLVEAGFSQLLAINSRIKSTDLVSIDSRFNGGIDKARFSLSKYVDAPEKVREKRAPATTNPEPAPGPKAGKVEPAPNADKRDPVKTEESPTAEVQFETLKYTSD